MRILFVVSSMGIGGSEKLSISLADEFVNNNNECGMFVIRSNAKSQYPYANKDIKIFYGGMGDEKTGFKYLLELRKAIRTFNPDVILCQSRISYVSVKIATWLIKKPAIFFAAHFANVYFLKEKILSKFVFALIKLSNDNIISSFTRQSDLFAKRYGVSSEKFTLIHNGVDTSFYCKKSEFKEKGTRCLNILHIGNDTFEKDQWTLLKALTIFNSKYTDWVLKFRGNISEDVQNDFNEYIQKYGLTAKIEFMDFVQDVRGLFENADVFVLTSISEALSISAIEAIAMGVPCILTNVGGCSDIVDDGENGFLVPPGDANALANRLLCLAKNTSLLETMSAKCRRKAVREFDLDIVSNNYLELFKSCVK